MSVCVYEGKLCFYLCELGMERQVFVSISASYATNMYTHSVYKVEPERNGILVLGRIFYIFQTLNS